MNSTQLPPRAISPKVEAKGFFPGAMVVRGLCWEWEDQDGGDGQIGKVTEIQEFHSKYRRNVARVQWLGNGVSNVYRIGHNGKVSHHLYLAILKLDALSECEGSFKYGECIQLWLHKYGGYLSNMERAEPNRERANQI